MFKLFLKGSLVGVTYLEFGVWLKYKEMNFLSKRNNLF